MIFHSGDRTVTLIILVKLTGSGLLPVRAMPELEKTETVFRFLVNIIIIYSFTYYFSITKTILPSVPPPE
jgi:hypothetical protein